MLSNKLTFSLASLVVLLIAAMVIVPSVVYADPPTFTLKSVEASAGGGILRIGDTITFTVTVDTVDAADAPPQFTAADPAVPVTLTVNLKTAVDAVDPLPAIPAIIRQAPLTSNIPAGATGQTADIVFTYTIVAGDMAGQTNSHADVDGIGLGDIVGSQQFTDSAATPNPAGDAITIAIDATGTTNADALAAIQIDAPTGLGVPQKATVALPSRTVTPGGFAIVALMGATASDTGLSIGFGNLGEEITNLNTLFNGNGGTLELTGAALGPIITEIMWGEDLSAPSGVHSSQWIEIYNASAAAVELSDYSLKITPYTPGAFTADEDAVDTVSNLGNGRWDVPGNGGRSMAVEADPTTGAGAMPAESLVSMYRNLALDTGGSYKASIDDKGTATDATDDVLKDVNDGTVSGSWLASTPPSFNIGANRVATPGEPHEEQLTRANQTEIPYSPVIINEIGIGSGDDADENWIELRAIADVNLKKYELSVITADQTKTVLTQFPDKDYNLVEGDILLIVDKDPKDTSIAKGKKFGDKDGMTEAIDQDNRGTAGLYYLSNGADDKLKDLHTTFATAAEALFVLRSESKDNYEAIIDVTGTLFEADTSISTHIAPLRSTPVGHSNVIDGNGETFAVGVAYKRNNAAGGTGEKDLGLSGYSGVGYDRSAEKSESNGTPGFDNGTVKGKIHEYEAADATGTVSISEIMYDQGGRSLPQWIEIYNSSQSHAVNLDGWILDLVSDDSDIDIDDDVKLTLEGGIIIPPNQTILIATNTGRDSGDFPETRLIVLWENRTAYRDELEMTHRKNAVLSNVAFTLTLSSPPETGSKPTVVDTVGNMGEDWELPMGDGDGVRSSILRVYDGGIAEDGTKAGSWILASDTDLAETARNTFYGDSDDEGSPGYRAGGAVPVSLSSFRPLRDKATGAVVIRWTTESELNNAGFNILRSETKKGEFQVVNLTGIIPGHGTTSEKHVYEWTDTSAKPNVVYYYQIEDVSLDGKRTTLRTTHLRGNVNAAGKAATTWGELKTYGK